MGGRNWIRQRVFLRFERLAWRRCKRNPGPQRSDESFGNREENDKHPTPNIQCRNQSLIRADVESIDAIIAAAYDVISGPGDKKRDWNRERSLFFPGARIIPTARVPGRKRRRSRAANVRRRSLHRPRRTAFAERFLRNGGRAANRTVWPDCSRLEHLRIRHDPSEPDPFMRGINSFQLFNDGKRWWILSICWQHESAEHAIPQRYL